MSGLRAASSGPRLRARLVSVPSSRRRRGSTCEVPRRQLRVVEQLACERAHLAPTHPPTGRRDIEPHSPPKSIELRRLESARYRLTESVRIVICSPFRRRPGHGGGRFRYRRRGIERQAMAKVTVDVLVDDLDGSEGAETVRLGWNGGLARNRSVEAESGVAVQSPEQILERCRPVTGDRQSSRRRRPSHTTSSRSTRAKRDPKVIRAWATEHRITMPARGRIPSEVEQQYNEATRRS
jgi:Lsr2